MGAYVRETSLNLKRRKGVGEKLGMLAGERGILGRRRSKHRRLQGLRAKTCMFWEVHADENY